MHLHIDPLSGAAGDMLLAACLDLGVEEDDLRALFESLGVEGWSLSVERLVRGGIASVHVQIDEHGQPHDHSGSDSDHDRTAHDAAHDHAHEHGQGHDHSHAARQEPSPAGRAQGEGETSGPARDHEHSPHDHAHPHPHGHGHDAGHAHAHHHAHPHPHPHARPHLHHHPYEHVRTPDSLDEGRASGASGDEPSPHGRGQNEGRSEETRSHSHDHAHPHDHGPAHSHDHEHAQEHAHHHHGPHRHLADLLAIVEAAPLSPAVRERCARVFRMLAEAEAAIHGVGVEQVHFHELSGIDTLLDVVGVCWCFERLKIARVTCSPVEVGSGAVRTAHGLLPVPAPATLEILRPHEVPLRQSDAPFELLTPTGAALLAELVDDFGPCPPVVCRRIGYGAGRRDLPDRPNVLRLMLGELESNHGTMHTGRFVETIVSLHAVVDDMTPEAVADCLERCREAGAVEAFAVPVVMKKSRPGFELVVHAIPDRARAVETCLWRNSSTFGLRIGFETRHVLSRTVHTVDVDGHPVRVKIASTDDGIERVAPEFEDCRRASVALGVSLDVVIRKACNALMV